MNSQTRNSSPLIRQRSSSIQVYARLAGVLILLSFIGGGFGEAYVPAKLAVSDAATTMENLRHSEMMFRFGFAGYLLEACCDVTLALLFYVLLKPVHRYVSLLAAFFGLLGTATFAAAELFYFAPTLLLRNGSYLKSFSPDQLNTLALLWFKLFGLGAAIFTVFYGLGWVLKGYLIFRSDYFSKFLGVLMAVGGMAFIVSNFTAVLAPNYRSDWLLVLMMPGLLLLSVWLLFKGVDVPGWERKMAGDAL